jgi:hypothetical protein
MPDLPQAQAGDFRYLLKRETGEIMHVDNLHGLGPGFSHFFHQQPDLDNLAGARGVGLLVGDALIEGDWGVERAALKRQPGPGKIHQHPAHGAPGDSVEMFAASDMPSAFVYVPEPYFVNQFDGRNGREIALVSDVAHG